MTFECYFVVNLKYIYLFSGQHEHVSSKRGCTAVLLGCWGCNSCMGPHYSLLACCCANLISYRELNASTEYPHQRWYGYSVLQGSAQPSFIAYAEFRRTGAELAHHELPASSKASC